MTLHDEFLKTEEVAKKLEISVPTVYKYVKEKKLTPVYEDKWRIDESLLFRPEDIAILEDELKKPPGYTTGEVAAALNVHPTTVSSYISKGQLHATKQFYRGREIYFVSNEEFEQFKRLHDMQNRRERKQFYSKETGHLLFQKLIHMQNNEIARIMELDGNEGKVITEDGRSFSLSIMKAEGFKVFKELVDQKYNTKRGFAIFKLPKPTHINSPAFNIIDLFYEHLGPKNMQLLIEGDTIHLEIKPVLIAGISEDIHEREINIIKKHLVEGKVEVRHNGILIDSDLEPLIQHVPSKFKALITSNAKKEGLTIEEYAIRLMKAGLKNNESDHSL
ncbi:helix-turn-helix domain-containing protein [Metabacillus herbersteinensis]|uniref:Helix-turn-helix domain-containing protein n=1 Tax=Metabacillus herbersteinensis TaxID=283816 RepID=A0ABV6GJH7_9BACI